MDRLRELEPLVREYNELQEIAAEMGLESPGGSSRGRGSGTARRRNAPARGRLRPAEENAASGEGGAATQGGGQVADRVLEAVRAEPGKTVAEYAEVLGVSATALYRPVRELTNAAVLVKRARQLFPA